MARLYANENFPLPVVEALRATGHDVMTVRESGKADQAVPDEETLDFAASEGRAVLTLNRKHFVRLHKERPEHAGIIVCTFDPDFERQARRIHDAMEAESGLAGHLIRINRPAG